MATNKIAIRTDTAAAWTSANPTLVAGEQGYETDTGRRKIGDGATAWTSLAYIPYVTETATQTLANKTIDGNSNTISNLGDAAVGTVSQSGGTPTGAVIERGSNANGEYVKFADGTQICYINKYISIVPDTAYGSLYIGTVEFDFPLSFVVTPVVSPGKYRWKTSANWMGIGRVNTIAGTAYIFDVAMRSSRTELFQVQAIGRWF